MLNAGARSRRRSRILHLAPQRCLHRKRANLHGPGHVCADAVPEEYPRAECLRLLVPQDLAMFPDGYFDFVIHNHILEHVPGSHRAHIFAFSGDLRPGGRMIFSGPDPEMGIETEAGGEHLASDAERKAKFGRYNHLKRFGRDLPAFPDSLEGEFRWDGLAEDERRRLGATGPRSNRAMIRAKPVAAQAAPGAGGGAAGPDREMPDTVRAGVRRLAKTREVDPPR